MNLRSPPSVVIGHITGQVRISKYRTMDRHTQTSYMIGILLQIERKIKLIDNWSNKTNTLRHRIQRTAGEVNGGMKCGIEKNYCE